MNCNIKLLPILFFLTIGILADPVKEGRVISDDGLMLRSGPSKDDGKIEVIPFDATVTIIDENGFSEIVDGTTGIWMKLKYKGKTGWSFGAFLRITEKIAGIEMVRIPSGGSYFYMGKYEVTQKQYREVMGVNPSYFSWAAFDPALFPVEMVNWYSAIEFCNTLSGQAGITPYYRIYKTKKDPENKNPDYQNGGDTFQWTVSIIPGAKGFRLPTSAEWEYACRAGTKTKYYWGDGDNFSVVDQFAVYRKNSGDKGPRFADYGSHRVGSKKPNPWGLYDMCGNVYEWCFDWHPAKYGKERVCRGSSWNNNAYDLQSSMVEKYTPITYGYFIGFRLARNP